MIFIVLGLTLVSAGLFLIFKPLPKAPAQKYLIKIIALGLALIVGHFLFVGEEGGYGAANSQQAAFLNALATANAEWAAEKNEIVQQNIRAARAKSLCAIITDSYVTGWRGIVDDVFLADDNIAAVSVALPGGQGVTLKTANNELTNKKFLSMVPRGVPLFEVLTTLKAGQAVSFSGRFFDSERDCLAEGSLTTAGSMRAPEFFFNFTDIQSGN